MKKTMKIIDTRKYYSLFLKEPKGRGGWVFECGGEVWFSPSLTLYSEACRMAKKHFADSDSIYIYVLP